MVFDDSIHFYGNYRPYQKRVLDNLEEFLDNKKVHVVAAPGSGKTILGLELIKRINEVSLVLTPSITIREQWIDRFSKNFLDDPSKANLYISRSIKEPRPIMCITYQAFYSAFKREDNKESVEEFIVEDEDYNDFDLVISLKKYKVKTICLDECHHLKAEWWRSIELVMKQLEDISLIALTATPPYDCNSNDWNRYIRLCGPIDDEIFVPELIHDNNLCPHQDYVYYCYPTKEEEKNLVKSYSNGIKMFAKYRNDKELVNLVKEKNVFSSLKFFSMDNYEKRDYYNAIALYMIENKVRVHPLIKRYLSNTRYDINHFEIILQNLLFDDKDSYSENRLTTTIKKELASYGLVHNCKIGLSYNDKLDKLMTMSLSKIDAIIDIVKNEIDVTKGKMKCLILADYIKMNTKNYIGSDKEIDSFGTIPIFEALRRANIDGVSLCLLSGSICIIEESCKKLLPNFEFESITEGYVEVKITQANRKELVSSITKLFEENIFNVLVGTKSLLGEGWDSPCINTLIMASFIGSYVLSNQTRGRAIRTNPNDKFKKSNIWHLVCVNPYEPNDSTDYFNLAKRFESFVGLDVENYQVLNGIERTGCDHIPTSREEISNLNEKSFEEAANRNNVHKIWNYCITNAKNLEYLTKMTVIEKKRLYYDSTFIFSLISLLLTLFIGYIDYNIYMNLTEATTNAVAISVISVVGALALFLTVVFLIRVFSLLNCRIKLLTMGKAILRSLRKSEYKFSKNIKVKAGNTKDKKCYIYLENASTFEQNMFSECISEFFGEPTDARYLLAKPNSYFAFEYYVVPSVFKKNKDLVNILAKELAKSLGKFKIVFAKNKNSRFDVIKANGIYKLKYKNTKIKTIQLLLKKKHK